jgi:hypothetical protein
MDTLKYMYMVISAYKYVMTHNKRIQKMQPLRLSLSYHLPICFIIQNKNKFQKLFSKRNNPKILIQPKGSLSSPYSFSALICVRHACENEKKITLVRIFDPYGLYIYRYSVGS